MSKAPRRSERIKKLSKRELAHAEAPEEVPKRVKIEPVPAQLMIAMPEPDEYERLGLIRFDHCATPEEFKEGKVRLETGEDWLRWLPLPIAKMLVPWIAGCEFYVYRDNDMSGPAGICESWDRVWNVTTKSEQCYMACDSCLNSWRKLFPPSHNALNWCKRRCIQ